MTKKEDNTNIDRSGFPIAGANYKWLILGVLLIIIGFLLMSGGRSDDPNVFSETIFSFRRITLAPIVVISGFVIVAVGLMKRPKEKD